MAELNDKLITYGNLSTFYDKLQEQGLGGNAIEDASVLPDAFENKDKFYRLSSDDNVYVSELIGTSTYTHTDIKPESEQIGEAFILNDNWFEDGMYIYDGTECTLTDGTNTYTGYRWYNSDNNYYIFSIKKCSEFGTISPDEIEIYQEEDNWVSEGNNTYSTISISTTTVDSNGYHIFIVYGNASDSSQDGMASIVYNRILGYYDSTPYTLYIDGTQYSTPVYLWNKNIQNSEFVISFVKAEDIHQTVSNIQTPIFYYSDVWEISGNTIILHETVDYFNQHLLSIEDVLNFGGEIETILGEVTETTEEWGWQPLTDNATNDDIDLMFESSSPVVKRVLMSDYASPLSIKEGLVNVSGETMEYEGQTYYKWIKYEEHDGESVIDDFGNDLEPVLLTTSLNPSLPFSSESPEYAYHLVIDGDEGVYWGLDTYPEEALIHEDGSITYEE